MMVRPRVWIVSEKAVYGQGDRQTRITFDVGSETLSSTLYSARDMRTLARRLREAADELDNGAEWVGDGYPRHSDDVADAVERAYARARPPGAGPT